ncbi:hypothetical protein EG878_14520 [Enterococcus faecalis]|nr:hypothetical protein EG878_14520 [Enterococcus faecalis]
MADITLGQHPMLKKEYIDRRFRDLVGEQFVADRLFNQTTVDALAIRFAVEDADKDATGKPIYDDVPEVGEGSNYERIGITEDVKTEMIKKYGLEAAITYEMQKFTDGAPIERAYRKLAMNVRKMVDVMAYNVLLKDASGIQKLDKTGNFWAGASAADNMINDIIDMRKALRDYGYEPDTLLITPEIEAALLKQKAVRDAFRENNTDVALLRGYIGDFMGLSFIVDAHFPADTVAMLQRGVIGDIADAEGMRTETYNEKSNDRTIVRVTRFTAAYLTDPKAVYKLTSIFS